jgi:hypothetical protein
MSKRMNVAEMLAKLRSNDLDYGDQQAAAEALEALIGEKKELRRQQLQRWIMEAQQDYQRRIEPWVKELGDIALCDPPKPVELPDGRTAQYIGPLPTWTPDGIKMPRAR